MGAPSWACCSKISQFQRWAKWAIDHWCFLAHRADGYSRSHTVFFFWNTPYPLWAKTPVVYDPPLSAPIFETNYNVHLSDGFNLRCTFKEQRGRPCILICEILERYTGRSTMIKAETCLNSQQNSTWKQKSSFYYWLRDSKNNCVLEWSTFLKPTEQTEMVLFSFYYEIHLEFEQADSSSGRGGMIGSRDPKQTLLFQYKFTIEKSAIC